MKFFKKFSHPNYRKQFLISFIWNGSVFATLMALFDFYGDKPFSIIQFLFYFFFQGIIMAFSLSANYKVNK